MVVGGSEEGMEIRVKDTIEKYKFLSKKKVMIGTFNQYCRGFMATLPLLFIVDVIIVFSFIFPV